MSRAKEKLLNKEIGKKVKQARLENFVLQEYFDKETNNIWKKPKKKLITQTELGKALGVTFQSIQRYESGNTTLSSIKLLEVSNFFNKPLEYFTSDATELLEKVRPTDNSSVKVTESLENV